MSSGIKTVTSRLSLHEDVTHDQVRPFLLNRYDNPRIAARTVNTRGRGRSEGSRVEDKFPKGRVCLLGLIYRPTRNTDLAAGGKKICVRRANHGGGRFNSICLGNPDIENETDAKNLGGIAIFRESRAIGVRAYRICAPD